MTESEFAEMLQRYLDGRSRPGERQLVERWSERLGRRENLRLPPQEQTAVRAAIWRRLERHLNPPAAAAGGRVLEHPASFWRAPPLRWAAAALLVLALSLAGLLRHPPQPGPLAGGAPAPEEMRHTNSTGRPQLVALLDGTRVRLYPGSTLTYRTGLAGPRREVQLVGKAFFQVHKDPAHPFLVYTNTVLTTVLGTSFLVQAYPGHEATVAVREGRVSVQARAVAQLAATPAHPAPTGVVLLPNQQVVYSPAVRQLRKGLVEQPVVLRPQLFEFRKRPVGEVLAALEKAYGVDIVYDQARLAHCTVTIAFYDESLFEKLSLLCKTLGASYQQTDEARILFQSAGCQAR